MNNEPNYNDQGHRPSQRRDSYAFSAGAAVLLVLMILSLIVANHYGWLPAN